MEVERTATQASARHRIVPVSAPNAVSLDALIRQTHFNLAERRAVNSAFGCEAEHVFVAGHLRDLLVGLSKPAILHGIEDRAASWVRISTQGVQSAVE